MQGTFVECASPAQVTLWLASVVLELVAAKEVHGHSQPFVRRSALIAASQARSNVPGVLECRESLIPWPNWPSQDALLACSLP